MDPWEQIETKRKLPLKMGYEIVQIIEGSVPKHCPEIATEIGVAPRDALSMLRLLQEAGAVRKNAQGAWEVARMAKKEDMLAQLSAMQNKKGSKIKPKDAPEPEEEEADEPEEEEEEDDDEKYDLDKPVKDWSAEALRAYAEDNDLPSAGKVSELRKMVGQALAQEEEEEDEAPPKASKKKAKEEPKKASQKDLAAALAAGSGKKKAKVELEEEDEAPPKASKKKAKTEPEEEEEDEAPPKASKKKAKTEPEEEEEEDEAPPKAPKKKAKTEPEEDGETEIEWGEFELFVNCRPEFHDTEYEEFFLSDLLAEARQLASILDLKQGEIPKKLRHWAFVEYQRGGSVVAALFREQVAKGDMNLDQTFVVCDTFDPGQDWVIQLLRPHAQRVTRGR